MHWTEPATSEDSHAELEKKLWDAANMLWAGADLKPSEYSPTSIVRLIVEILEPYHGRIFDPACVSGCISFRPRPSNLQLAPADLNVCCSRKTTSASSSSACLTRSF